MGKLASALGGALLTAATAVAIVSTTAPEPAQASGGCILPIYSFTAGGYSYCTWISGNYSPIRGAV